MSNDPPKISLIIPAYNEADRIAASLETVSKFVAGETDSYEVLLVNDGSRDRTPEIVREISPELFPDGNFQLLEYGANRGKGYAVRHGIEKAQGDYIVFSDTDLSAPIDQIPKLVASLVSGADVAIGSRRVPQSEVVGLPFSRRVMSRFFSILSQWLVLPGIRDTQCGFKAYRAKAAKELARSQQIDGYTFDVEHLLISRKRGFLIEEVPVRWVYTEGSQINGFSDSIKMVRDLLDLRRRR
ncbi:MAG: glycosyltransferase family 2 protein [Candidatus Omnitrophica bacterium]|nr:glycosyltransferase family 2 protein [Candidatus Omnitrophota bacterium]